MRTYPLLISTSHPLATLSPHILWQQIFNVVIPAQTGIQRLHTSPSLVNEVALYATKSLMNIAQAIITF